LSRNSTSLWPSKIGMRFAAATCDPLDYDPIQLNRIIV
jgi:hypothetical protein